MKRSTMWAIVAIVAVAGIGTILYSSNAVTPILKDIRQSVDNPDANDPRVMGSSQDDDAKTQVLKVQDSKQVNDPEKFLVETLTIEPQSTKRITFKTAPADSVTLQGTAIFNGPGEILINVATAACDSGDERGYGYTFGQDCENPKYIHGDNPKQFKTQSGPFNFALKGDQEYTLLLINKLSGPQTVNLDLSITYKNTETT